MQGENDTIRDFSRRTDMLASALDIPLEELWPRLRMSRASFFGYRGGNRPITFKAWQKLESLEKEAGLTTPFQSHLDDLALAGRVAETAEGLDDILRRIETLKTDCAYWQKRALNAERTLKQIQESLFENRQYQIQAQ